MARTPPPSFHLRLPPDLKAKLQSATAEGRNSLNTEIVERLDRSFDPDTALQLAEILRPVLASIDEEDRARLVALAAEAADVIIRSRAKRRPQRRR